MMTYDAPMVTTLSYQAHDFGAGGATKTIVGPKGARGKVLDVLVSNVSETFTNTTTAAKVQAGVAGDLGKFVDFGLGTTASGSATSASRGDAVTQEVAASDEPIVVTFVAPTGGTPGGIADVQVVVGWFN